MKNRQKLKKSQTRSSFFWATVSNALLTKGEIFVTTRRWYLLGVAGMIALGVGLLFAPFPVNPRPGDSSDMQFYGILMALFGAALLSFGAIVSPKLDEPITLFIGGMALFSGSITLSAYLLAWFG